MEEGGENINSAALTIAIIFIPGIICYAIIASLGEKREREKTTVFLQMFIYGMISYLVLSLASYTIPNIFPKVNIPLLEPAKIEGKPINPIIVGLATLIATIQAIIITVSINYDIALRLCRRMGITKRFGDSSIWTFILNSYDTNNWATIRSEERGLIYQGYVRAFSTVKDRKEILLVEVEVFDFNSAEKVADIPVMYISFAEDKDIILEFGVK